MKCPRCDERLCVVLNEAMGKSLECECGVKVEIPYGEPFDKDQVDGPQKE